MNSKISLIIPCYNAQENLNKILLTVNRWILLPDEIIIIDSSDKKYFLSDFIRSKIQKIEIKIIYQKNTYPGHARNIGIKSSKNDILAFLDTSTFPSNKWLKNTKKILDKKAVKGVWGFTKYEAYDLQSCLIRASTYGSRLIETVPGSIIYKDVFNQVGLFIEYVRAGEDVDWSSRVKLHKISFANSDETLIYEELNNINIFFLIKKWFRNYMSGSRLPIYNPHKDIYFMVASIISIFIAYNWNNLLASWDTNSVYYIPNITKIISLGFISIYFLIRGVHLPIKKNTKINFIFPFNFILISLISLLLDITKLTAFIFTKFKKK